MIKLNDLELIMKENEIPIKAYVYDSYSKVIYIQTDNNVLIPVEPRYKGIYEFNILSIYP